MSALRQVLVTCDGILAKGCPFMTRAVVEEQYPMTARKFLLERGWDYQRITNSSHNVVQHIDVCNRCLLYANES